MILKFKCDLCLNAFTNKHCMWAHVKINITVNYAKNQDKSILGKPSKNKKV